MKLHDGKVRSVRVPTDDEEEYTHEGYGEGKQVKYTYNNYYQDSSDEEDFKTRRNKHGQQLCKGERNTCKRRARDTKTGLCVTCGGGTKCEFEGCTNSARTRSTRCVTHGGGIRCSEHGCHKTAVDKNLCKDHGGEYKRCTGDWGTCPSKALYGTSVCTKHGALELKGKLCEWPVCSKLLPPGKKTLCSKHQKEAAKKRTYQEYDY